MASRLPVQSGIGILNILVIAQFDTAQGVHHVLQTAELDLRHMVDFLAGNLLDVAYQGFLAGNLRHRIDFMYWLSTFISESRGMEISELGPLLGLISTRIVSVLKPEILSTPP